jgi:uncharacterized membrane protein
MPSSDPRMPEPAAVPLMSRTAWSGALSGVGAAAFVDETFFHQLLHWHHFYDKSTATVGLVSDGLFHAGGFTCIVVGLFLMADTLRRDGFVPKRWWGALLVGAGGFQLYDGIVQHKIFRLHQIRYHVTIWPYDVTWDAIAVIFVLVGIVLLRTGTAGVAGPGIFRTVKPAPPGGRDH